MNSLNSDLKCIQINLCRSKYATTHLINFMDKLNITIAFIQEPYVLKGRVCTLSSNYESFFTNSASEIPKSAILLRKSSFIALNINSYSNECLTFVSISFKNKKILLISAYMPPTIDISVQLNHIKRAVDKLKPKYFIISTDSNARSQHWFDHKNNSRGQQMSEFIIHNKLIVLNNNRNSPTFDSHQGKSSIDLTLINENMINFIKDWNLLEINSMSDHKYITFRINDCMPDIAYKTTLKYNTKAGDWSSFLDAIRLLINELKSRIENITNTADLEDIVICFTNKLNQFCEQHFPEIKSNANKKSNKWWTRELTIKRRSLCRARRRYQRCQTNDRNSLKLMYKTLETEYKDLIDKTRHKSWNTFLEQSSTENPWGLAFKISKDKIFQPKLSEIVDSVGNPIIDEKSIANKLFDALFPTDDHNSDNEVHKQLRNQSLVQSLGSNDKPFTIPEITDIVNKQNPRKAPGFDGITADIIQKVHEMDETFLHLIYKTRLEYQYFPKLWKQSIVKIIPKPNKSDYRNPNAYRPISLISVYGKILEKLLINRINDYLHKNSLLNRRQYGFTSQTSTVDALRSLTDFIQKCFDQKGFAIVLSLDINGAFNSCFWPKIINQLRIKECPNNLLSLVKSYFSDRESKLWFMNIETTRQMSVGCPQGSASGPGFWNVSIDDIFDLSDAQDIEIECFADDTIVKIFDKNIDNLELKTNDVLNKLKQWADNNKLSFNVSKTNCALFTRKLKYRKPEIYFNGEKLQFVTAFKHLGVMIDTKLSWRSHANYIKAKVAQFVNNLLRFAKINFGIDSKALEMIYKGAVLPAIGYGIPVWVNAINKKFVIKPLEQLQRQIAIRYTKSYKTVSYNAVNIIANFTPIDI